MSLIRNESKNSRTGLGSWPQMVKEIHFKVSFHDLFGMQVITRMKLGKKNDRIS